MLKKIITYQWLIWLLAGMLLSPPVMAAQDTVSTAGVTFAPSANDSKGSYHQKETKTAVQKLAPVAHNQEKRSLWAIFIAGLLGGFAALLMPCIFPMLPLTVSFFTKGAENKGKVISKALLYGLSIIVIYVVLGLLVTVIFGADALNSLSTNGIFNFSFFLLLVVFAASFLGAFEITLPGSWVNKMDQNADKGGLAGLFFMAATLALVSFSCTGPIIGTLLVQAATTGALLGPAIGMFGFALALSIPFALFAMFPGLMSSLPKSGGWLNSVKVVLGFLELAFSLKFLSNVDLAYHWQWFDREIFLALWIVIFGLLGLYLLGKLHLNHDTLPNGISVPRLFTGILIGAFTLYMVPGLWGAPLKSIAAFLPPQDTQDFDLYTPTLSNHIGINTMASGARGSKYTTLFHAPLGLPAFFDYQEGLTYARKVHKPVLIDFTGHACVNCRKMEATIWPDQKVLPLIRDQYVLIQLYVDDKTEISGGTTIGQQNSELQASRFNSNSQPDYVLLDPTGNLLVQPGGAIYDPVAYAAYLQTGLNKFNKIDK
jgi:thiol:disulfide interchange protein